MNSIELVKATRQNIGFIADVYNYYVLNSTATFHTQPASESYLESVLPWEHSVYETFLIKVDGKNAGFCYLGNFKPREAYNRSSEISIYILPDFQKKGVGLQVLVYLEGIAKQKRLKNLIGVITDENRASVKLFEKNGYQKVGHLKNIGEKFGRLLDVVTYQKEI